MCLISAVCAVVIGKKPRLLLQLEPDQPRRKRALVVPAKALDERDRALRFPGVIKKELVLKPFDDVFIKQPDPSSDRLPPVFDPLIVRKDRISHTAR